MFYEYAVEPTVLSSWQSVRYFLDAFGPWKGRFIAAYPKRWKKLVYESLRCPDVEKKHIEVRLSTLDPRVFAIRNGSYYDSAQPWLDNALAEHGRQAFRAIIAASGAGREHVLQAGLVDETNELWRVDQGSLIPRNPQAFSKSLGLLIRLSSRVIVIDPFFRPQQPAKSEVLASVCRAVNLGVSVEVHVRLGSDGDPSPAWFRQQCEAHLPQRIPDGVTVAVHAWSQRAGGPRLHDRYVLTEIGGVQFGDSVETGAGGEVDRLSILEELTRARLWLEHVEPGDAFDRVGTVVTVAGRATRP